MPSLDDFLYNEDELILSSLIRSLIRENRASDAAKYVARYPIIKHSLDSLDQTRPLNIGAIPVSLQINDNPRQRLIINPDRCGYPAPTYNGAEHIFSQSKLEWKAAIHYAAERGMTDVVRLLIAKADRSSLSDYVNIKDAYGRTPLHYAAIGGHEETMQYLVRAGADTTEKDANQSSCPWEMMDRTKTYSRVTLELMSRAAPINAKSTDLSTNLLYRAISDNNEPTAKNLVFDESIYFDHGRCVEKARENGNENLVNYLNFAHELRCILREYRISLMQDYSSTEAKNMAYVDLIKNSLDSLARHNSTAESRQYNAPVILELIKITSAAVNNISYDFREKSYNLIPWQNLESLSYSANNIRTDNDLLSLFKRELPNICAAFSTLRESLDRINPDGTIAGVAPPNDDRIAGLQSIYLITDLVTDLRSLEKISSFIDTIDTIDTERPMGEGRLALLAMVKQLGEFSKHSQQCNNLSPVAKQYFSNMPWKILEDLRDHVAKAPSRPRTRPMYDSLLQDADDGILLKIRSDISYIALQARDAHSAIIKQVRDHGIADSYYRASNISNLSAEQQQELLDDLNAELTDTTRKNQRETRSKIIQDVRAYFDPAVPDAEIKTYAQLQEKVFGNFFKSADDPRKLKWTHLFHGRSGIYDGIERCYDGFESSASTAINYASKANAALDKMMELIICDPEIIADLKASHDLPSKPPSIQQHLFERLKSYNNSPKLRLAIEQLYSELWLVTNHMGATIQMDDNNTKMRNFIEHKNSIYDTTDRDIDRATFLEFVGVMFNTHDRLVAAGFRAPSVIPQPVMGIGIAVVAPPIILGM